MLLLHQSVTGIHLGQTRPSLQYHHGSREGEVHRSCDKRTTKRTTPILWPPEVQVSRGERHWAVPVSAEQEHRPYPRHLPAGPQ